jgi:molybdate transport system substrate-binding protein
MKPWTSALAIGAAFFCASGVARAQTAGPTIFAAASMKTALDAIASAWKDKTGKPVVISYGSSGTLAKQIEAGAPADLFISADQKWMDVLAKDGAIKPATRRDLVGNALVLVAPADAKAPALAIDKGVDLAGALGDGKLAVCTVTSCPAGIYGKEALIKLGVWADVAPKLAQADNVRAALLLVARGEAKYGIVYATDAKAEPKVKVVGTFPDSSHEPIVYPVALTASAQNPDAAAFEDFLRTPGSVKLLMDQGFVIVGR